MAVDGSSTVFPITEAVAEEFRYSAPGVRVTVGISGTGGGFKRFCNGETDVSNASRPIKDSERQACAGNRVQFIELAIAFDGLSVVVSSRNDFVDFLTVAELKRIWEPGSKVTRWNQVRPQWPDQRIELFGPGTDSGTFDYFTEVIVGTAGASRADYTASEDDNVLVQGVSGDRNALGYFGYAYYAENQGKLRLLQVDGGKGCILPKDDTIENGAYPLARPLFIYVSRKSLGRPEVRGFVQFYLEQAQKLVREVGYVPFHQAVYQDQLAKLK